MIHILAAFSTSLVARRGRHVLTVARHNSIHLQDDADDCDEDDVDEQEDDGIEFATTQICALNRI